MTYLEVLKQIRADPERLLGERCMLRLDSFLMGFGFVATGGEPEGFRDVVVQHTGYDNRSADGKTLLRLASEDDRAAFEKYFECTDQMQFPQEEVTSYPEAMPLRQVLEHLKVRPAIYLRRFSVTALVALLHGYQFGRDVTGRKDLLPIPVPVLLDGLAKHLAYVPGQSLERIAQLWTTDERATFHLLDCLLRKLPEAAAP